MTGRAPVAPRSVRRLLGDDERALLSFRASPLMIVIDSWIPVVILAALGAGALWLGAVTAQPALGRYLGAGAAAAAALRLLWGAARWLARRYALTDERALRIEGVLGRLTLEAPLERIEQTVALQRPAERIFGLGTIGFMTAATGGADLYWAGVGRPYEKLRAARRAIREATPRPRESRRGRWPLVIGLAGGIGSGKSAVARLLGELGAVVSDSDAEAREALRRDDVRARLVELWGREILDEQGNIDRAVVAGIVFSLPEARERLERIVHPIVRRARLRKLVQARRSGAPALVIDAPLLFEAGVDRECDLVIFVDTPEAERIARVQATRGWDEAELRRREAVQMDLTEKRRRADEVIVNDADEQTLRERVRSLFAGKIAPAAGRPPARPGGRRAETAV
ncbi:MAG: dephospho-CoA kinase [Phycisphaerales bacterium JB039]